MSDDRMSFDVPAQLSRLYARTAGSAPSAVELLPGAGSNRRYYRIHGQTTMIGVAGTDAAENKAFVELSHHFHSIGIPVPEVYDIDEDSMTYLQEDLGTTSLFDFISSGRENGEWTDEQHHALRRTIAALPKLQWEGARGLDFSSVCFPVASMDRQSLMWDLNYFKYCFLKPMEVDHSEVLLERDFTTLCDKILRFDTPTFMYRDFQSRNVMLDSNGSPRFIDFQGGRRGPYHYDVVSFLWQAKAHYPQALRDELIDEYIRASEPYINIDPIGFRRELCLFVLLRTLQVLGAYGLRGLVQRKPHFINSIPAAIDNLRTLLADMPDGMPHLHEVLQRIVSMPRWNSIPENRQLTVSVNSFGFRKSGIPDDDTPNGGGFVFDCRALSNPGRYVEYRSLTGRDQAVIDYLENDSGITEFLSHAYALVDVAVERYMARGFTHLMVSFGCTGGQHRSVYSAEHMARHIHEKYGVHVILRHIEQGITDIFQPVSSKLINK